MAQRITIEEKLSALSTLERDSSAPKVAIQLNLYLRDPQNIVAARAASIIARLGLESCIPELISVLTRLLKHSNPAQADKTCRAKEAIVLALHALRNPDPDPYLLGIGHVQLEPVWGGRADTAAPLRAHCATALARMRFFEAHFALTPLLVDAEAQPRLAAVRALVFLAGERSELLLRLKVLTGDTDLEVINECYLGLLEIEPDRSLPFIAGFLNSADAPTVESAALALGASRHANAFPLLRAAWEQNTDLTLRKSLLLSFALTRTVPAFDYLLQIMRDEGGTTAILACDALALYGVDPRYRDRLEAAVVACHNPKLSDAYSAHFPPTP